MYQQALAVWEGVLFFKIKCGLIFIKEVELLQFWGYCGGWVVFMFQFSQFIGCSQFGKGSSNCRTTFGGLYFKGGELSTFRFSFMLGAKSYA